MRTVRRGLARFKNAVDREYREPRTTRSERAVMTSIPTGGPFPISTGKNPMTMFGPDFPFAYDDYVKHPADLGSVPAEHHGREVAVIGGGCAGMVAAYELMKLGLRPILYEGDQIGGRLKSRHFEGYEDAIAEMGAMRFPPSSTTLYHYFDLCRLETVPFPNCGTPFGRACFFARTERFPFRQGNARPVQVSRQSDECRRRPSE